MKRVLVIAFITGLIGASEVGAVTVYNQPSNYPTGAIFTSVNDTDSGGIGNFATVYDNFTLANTTSITDVHWQGAFIFDPPISQFTLTFWGDVAGAPGASLSTYAIPGNANETLVDVAQQVYNYSVDLPAPFVATGGTNYWLSIVPDLSAAGGATVWGWHSGTDGDGKAIQEIQGLGRSFQQTDMAFSLTAEGTGGNPVPEPMTAGLGLLSLGGLALYLRRRR